MRPQEHGNRHHGKLRNRIELRLGPFRVRNTWRGGRWHDKSYQREYHSESKHLHTILAGNYSSAINATTLTDDNTTPTSGNVSIRIVNASPALGTADVLSSHPEAA